MSTLWVEKLTRFDRDRPTTWANGRKDNALESRRFLAHLSQRRFYGKWSEFDSIRIKSFHGSDGVEGGTGGRQWQRNQRKDERIKSKGLHGRNSILIQWRGKKKPLTPGKKRKPSTTREKWDNSIVNKSKIRLKRHWNLEKPAKLGAPMKNQWHKLGDAPGINSFMIV